MLVDLSMPLSPKTVPVPGHPEPTFTPLHLLERDGLRNTVMSLSLHTATHIDAPSHFIADGAAIDEIAIDRFHRPGLRLDLTGSEPGSQIGLQELTAAGFDAAASRESILMLATGWTDRAFETPQLYGGNPYLALDAAEAIAAAAPSAIGLDFAVDRGRAVPEPRRAPGRRRAADREPDAPARAPAGRVHCQRLPDPDRRGERRARTRGRGASRVNIGRVHHMGMIVADLDRAIGGFRDVLGLELDHTEPYGEELDIAFLPCGEVLVELIQPLTAEGFSADWLASAGPGIQHVAFEVDDLDAALQELADKGVRPTGAAPRPGAGNTIIAFLEPERFGGIIVELVQPR